ncbi:MAG TPA: hypothetical protein V6D08_17265 [Candidatus Obscuribacterales bacterium]
MPAQKGTTTACLAALVCLLAAQAPVRSATTGQCPSPQKSAITTTLAGLPAGPLMVEMKDGRDFIQNMVSAARRLGDYSFQSEMIVYKAKGQVREATNFYFKRPRLMRVEVTEGPKKGAVAVLRSDGKVRAHLGGAFKFFVVTLEPHASELNSANDYPMVDSDLISLAEFLDNWVKQGIRSRVSADSMTLDGTNRQVYVLEMYKDNDQGRVLKRVFVDANTLLPVEWYDYANGQLWSKSVFKNIRPNIALNDKLFVLR